MRVLQVITDTDRRGAQVFASDLGTALGGRGHDVHTVALAAGTRQPPLDVEVLGRRARGVSTLRSLRSLMADRDVTIAHGSATLLACSLAGTGSHRPFVYRQISDSQFWAPTRRRRWRVTAYLRAPQRIVALSGSSRATLENYLRVPTDRIDVVPNGVPRGSFAPPTPAERDAARAELGLPSHAFVALYIGALVPEKGADVAVRAVAELADADGDAQPDVHLAVAGGGPSLDELTGLAESTAADRVHFVGQLSDTLPAYRAADVVLLPSKGGDSMPATLIEAGFCGLPSVSTPIGAIEDVVLHERTGLITPPDDVDALVAALHRLVDDPELRARLGDAALEHCRGHFDIEVVAEAWEASLEAALAA